MQQTGQTPASVTVDTAFPIDSELMIATPKEVFHQFYIFMCLFPLEERFHKQARDMGDSVQNPTEEAYVASVVTSLCTKLVTLSNHVTVSQKERSYDDINLTQFISNTTRSIASVMQWFDYSFLFFLSFFFFNRTCC